MLKKILPNKKITITFAILFMLYKFTSYISQYNKNKEFEDNIKFIVFDINGYGWGDRLGG